MFGIIFSKTLFKERLKKQRVKAGYRSQEKLAARLLNITTPFDQLSSTDADSIKSKRRTISNWESGKATPSLEEFVALCDILECDPEYLLFESCSTPRRETKKVMDVTGLDESVVGYLIRLQEEDKDSLRVLNRLLNCEGIDHLLYLLNFCSYCISNLDDEIDRAKKYAHEELDPHSVADEDYVGDRWWSIPSGVDDEYANLRRWRFEISHHFSKLVDDLFEIEKMDKAVADISKIYNTPRVGKT